MLYDEAVPFAQAMTTAHHRHHRVDTLILRIFQMPTAATDGWFRGIEFHPPAASG